MKSYVPLFVLIALTLVANTRMTNFASENVALELSSSEQTALTVAEIAQNDFIFSLGDDWDSNEYATSIAFGDIDGDGLDEIGVTRKSSGGFRYWVFDDEHGGFAPLKSGGEEWPNKDYARKIAFGDIDGDDRDEMVIVHQSDGTADLLILDDAEAEYEILMEGFSQAIGLPFIGSSGIEEITSVALGDTNDDGIDDLGFTVKFNANNLGDFDYATILLTYSEFLNLFMAALIDPGISATSIAFGNIDGDYKSEYGVALSHRSGHEPLYRFLIRDHAPEYQLLSGSQSVDWPRDATATGIAFGDIDGDGRDEIGVARESEGEDTTFIIYDDAGQGFTELYRSDAPFERGPTYSEATSIAFADVDGDGLDEVAIGHINQHFFPDDGLPRDRPDFWVLDDLHHGFQEIFAKGSSWDFLGSPTSIAFGDIDGDGAADIGISYGNETYDEGPRVVVYKISEFSTVRLIIEEVHGLDDFDTTSPPDFYPRVEINGQPDTRREIEDQRHITPYWTFSEQAHLVPNVGVNIEIWDGDGGFNFGDNQADITPDAGRTLNLTVEMQPCIVRYYLGEPIYSTFEIPCGELIEIAGTADEKASIKFRIEAFSPPIRQVDLVAQGLEITQGIQDLQNSVRLVEGKRTFVRLHSFARKETSEPTSARLYARRVGSSQIVALDPENPSILVHTAPRREILNHTFYWELPSEYTSGEVELWAEVNPITETRPRQPIESNYSNNTAGATVHFETVPTIDLTIVRVGLGDEAAPDYPPLSHVVSQEAYLENLFPVSEINVTKDSYFHGGKPSCDEVNARLKRKAIFDDYFSSQPYLGIFIFPEPDSPRYLALTTGLEDNTGCASGIPSFTASSTDSGGYNHGAHELGHAYGEYHLEVCSASAPPWIFTMVPDYPYADGHISQDFSSSGFFGFEFSNDPISIKTPEHYDLMGYCHPRWISDFRYERLMNYFRSGRMRSVDIAQEDSIETMSGLHMVLVGSIQPGTYELHLEPIFVLPDASTLVERPPSDVEVALLNASGTEIARYPLAINAMADLGYWSVEDLIPYFDGTAAVVIEGPHGAIATLPVSPNKPVITVTQPVAGTVVTDDGVKVGWAASDPDQDSLSYMVQYSADSGETWITVAPHVSGNEVQISREAISASEQGMFRVWASDGINTVFASSAIILVPNLSPAAEIMFPESGITIAVKQALALSGEAYDVDDGPLGAQQIEWRSDIDGLIGSGEDVTTANLSEGTHHITFSAEDSLGVIASDVITVHVVRDTSRLPDPGNELLVGPDSIVFNPKVGLTSGSIFIDNRNPFASLRWNAVVDQGWVRLEKKNGSTPDELAVFFEDPGSMVSGENRAVITITSPDLPGQEVTLDVSIMIPFRFFFMPLSGKHPGPDLVVESVTFDVDDELEITIKNVGTLPTSYPFWLDLYIDPDPVPTKPNDIWADGRSKYGLVWHIGSPVPPGESITLTIDDPGFRPQLSRFPGKVRAGTPIYLQVDSANTETTFGGVHEMHELFDVTAPYNNIVVVEFDEDVTIAAPLVATHPPEEEIDTFFPLRPTLR